MEEVEEGGGKEESRREGEEEEMESEGGGRRGSTGHLHRDKMDSPFLLNEFMRAEAAPLLSGDKEWRTGGGRLHFLFSEAAAISANHQRWENEEKKMSGEWQGGRCQKHDAQWTEDRQMRRGGSPDPPRWRY